MYLLIIVYYYLKNMYKWAHCKAIYLLRLTAFGIKLWLILTTKKYWYEYDFWNTAAKLRLTNIRNLKVHWYPVIYERF